MTTPNIWIVGSKLIHDEINPQAELKTLQNLSTKGYHIVTANSPDGVTKNESVEADAIASQFKSLNQVSKPDAIKISLFGKIPTSSLVIKTITNFLTDYIGYVVLDLAALESFDNLDILFPLVDIVILNVIDAEILLNCSINFHKDPQIAVLNALPMLGAKSILLKGKQEIDRIGIQDYWTNGIESFWISNPNHPHQNYPGAGYVLSTAITACLAQKYSIKDAIVIAAMYTHRAIRLGQFLNKTMVRLFHDGWPEDEDDLPHISLKPTQKINVGINLFTENKVHTCQTIGLYPIVDSSDWLEKLLPLGVKFIQLRIKDLNYASLAVEIKHSLALAKRYNAILFINDHWELAIQFGTHGVHLGQEDLVYADIEAIQKQGLYLGISTHCYYEVARAHALNPSYIACGPIYSTTTKIMPFEPQGIDKLKRWRRTLRCPLVAIGGINQERLSDVWASGVNGVALISAIQKATDPLASTKQLLALIEQTTE